MPEAIELGVNIDHVATLRQARRGRYPDPVHAALSAESAGADSITLHLREDRRHIQDQDVRALRPLLQTRMNLEMAVTDEMLAIAVKARPHAACIVPENVPRMLLGIPIFCCKAWTSVAASLRANPGARLKDTVTDGNTPW